MSTRLPLPEGVLDFAAFQYLRQALSPAAGNGSIPAGPADKIRQVEAAYNGAEKPNDVLHLLVDSLRSDAGPVHRAFAARLAADMHGDDLFYFERSRRAGNGSIGSPEEGVIDLMTLFAAGVQREKLIQELAVQRVGDKPAGFDRLDAQLRLFWALVFDAKEQPEWTRSGALKDQAQKLGRFFDLAFQDIAAAQIEVKEGMPPVSHRVLDDKLVQLKDAIMASTEIPAEQKAGFYEELMKAVRTITIRMNFTRDDGSQTPIVMMRVQNNDWRGPYKGGIRYVGVRSGEDFENKVHRDEGVAFFLAHGMTLKTAVANIPYGGGKGDVFGPALDVEGAEKLTEAEQKRLFFTLGLGMAEYVGEAQDIPAPDMGTNGMHMAAFRAAVEMRKLKPEPGTITGKPVASGGIKGREEATGAGGDHIIDLALKQMGRMWEGVLAVVQGFGNVGNEAAVRIASHEGAKVMAVSDRTGFLYNPDGISLDELKRHAERAKKEKAAFRLSHVDRSEGTQFFRYEVLPSGELLWDGKHLFEMGAYNLVVPAAMEYLLKEKEAQMIASQPDVLVVPLANAPLTPQAEDILAGAGKPVIPDILANGGGVVVSFLEMLQNIHPRWHGVVAQMPQSVRDEMNIVWKPVADELADQGWEAEAVLGVMRRILSQGYQEVELKARQDQVTYAKAADRIAVDRLYKARHARRRVDRPAQKAGGSASGFGVANPLAVGAAGMQALVSGLPSVTP